MAAPTMTSGRSNKESNIEVICSFYSVNGIRKRQSVTKPPVPARTFFFSKAASSANMLRVVPLNDRNHGRERDHGCSHTPRWRRVHHSWIFWVAVFLMLLAIVTYVMTGDLFWALHRQ